MQGRRESARRDESVYTLVEDDVFCDGCFAVNLFAKAPKALSYKNFRDTIPWRDTIQGHKLHLRMEGEVSPFSKISGWRLETVFRDLAHIDSLGFGTLVVG